MVAYKQVSIGFVTAKKMIKTRRIPSFIPTFCNKIDNTLEGGIELGSITEVFGESKSGKTQFCHFLCVTVQVDLTSSFYNFKIIFIDTEGNFTPERLISMGERFNLNIEYLLKNIFYARAYNTEHQSHLLVAAASLITYTNVRLIIIDSCTSLYRIEFSGRGELFLRQSLLGKFLRNLYRLSDEYNISILITNQVVASSLEGSNLYSGPNIKPIGGNIMAHYTNTRIWLKKSTGESRILKVISSSRISEKVTKFKITDEGLYDLNE